MILRIAVILLGLFLSFPAHSNLLEITVLSTPSEDRDSLGTSFAGITVEVNRPVNRAVELALYESSTLFEALGITVKLNYVEILPEQEIQSQLSTLNEESLFILDLPLPLMENVARVANELGIASVNVRHRDAYLRETLCLPHLYHTIPSDQMYFDALGQFLVFRGWRKILVIRGPGEQDAARTEVLTRSLKKFGATVEDVRVFTLSHHPDDRDNNKPEFITGGVSYDAVAVIDSKKDYGRYLQYSTRSPRPVVGDFGLVPVSWHFALERYGAPQLNERYREFNTDQSLHDQAAMTDVEFAAWSAVKLITNSINTRVKDAPLNVSEILSDPDSQVDLYKGTRGSVRTWNNQLRQPILLAASDSVIAIAPMPKFLHPKHYVDTLGIDEPESRCRLR